MVLTLTNREISVIIWLLILMIFLLRNRSVRASFLNVVKTFFHRYILRLYLFLIFYVAGIIYFFYKIDWWEFSLFKETFLWFFGVAFGMALNSNKILESGYFKTTFKQILGWTVF